MSDLKTIILAAGKGVRMKSVLPKVLHQVCGRPMIQYVVDIAQTLGSLKTVVVLGHQLELVKKVLDKKLVVVQQRKLLGTADAILSASSQLKNYHGDVLVLCGDTPLLTKATVLNLVKKHINAKAA